jgi:hypothetical protein
LIIIKTTNERFLGETPEDQIEKSAYLQVKTIWSILLRKFDCELCQEHPQPDLFRTCCWTQIPMYD